MYPSFQYFCSICVLFDEEKGQYHCKGCGLCRLGGEDKFFHCDKCEMCLPVSLQPSHKVCITYCSINDISFKTIMPCPFTGPKMFWAGPNFLCQTKNLLAVTNILCQEKK